MEDFLNNIWAWAQTQGLKIVLGLVVLWISFKIINVVFKKLDKNLTKKDVDQTIKNYTISITRKAIKLILIVCYVGFIGIETSSIAAVIASAAITVGLALQGSLSNLAGGVIILVMRPFKLGDFIENNGISGTVDRIEMFYTYLQTPDNKIIIIPNSKASDSTTINYSMRKTRRLDLSFSIAYENDFRKAKRLIAKEIDKIGTALNEPAEPFINVAKHNDSSIDILVRIWVNSADYWDTNWKMMEAVKLAFDRNGINIPYQQIDVHLKDDKADTRKAIDEDDEVVKEEIAFEERKKEEILERKQALKEAEEKEKQIESKKISNKIKKVIKLD